MSDDPNVVKLEQWAPELKDNWDEFQHKFIGEPEVKAEWRDGELFISVYVKGKHWVGPREPPWILKHGMGYILKPQDMVLLTEKGETPYRRCLGFYRCAQCQNSESSA